MSDICIIIPARLESERLPGKVLLDIGGQPMLQRVWQVACDARAGAVYIATDNERIAKASRDFGANVLISTQQNSGTERIAEVIEQLSLADSDLVINLQGDEPLMPPDVLAAFAEFARTQQADACSIYSRLADAGRIDDPNCVKVVCDATGGALYFSRSRIPANPNNQPVEYRMHHGIYAYRAAVLREWARLPRGPLEQAEKLEQLRLLENGKSIAMMEAGQTIPRGVDTLEDLERVRECLQ